MNKGNYIGTLVLVAVLSAVIIFLMNRNRSYDWDVKIREDRHEPYDIGHFKEVLEATFNDDFEHLLKSSEFEFAADSGQGTMIYIDDQIKLSEAHITKLVSFLERGNSAIFSCQIIPENLIERITGVDFDIEYSELRDQHPFSFDHSPLSVSLASQNDSIEENLITYESDESEEESYNLYLTDSIAEIHFLDNPEEKYRFKFIQKDTVLPHLWSGISPTLFDSYNDSNDFTVVSKLNDSLYDVISMQHGDGRLIVHMNPILFSNIYFKEKSGFNYANTITSYFSEGKVYFNQAYNYISRRQSGRDGDGNSSSYDRENVRSPLSFVLAHKGLKWTLYGILLLSLLYLLFAFKRRLPVIEYFQQPKNTSISYVQALSSFYSSAKDHALLSTEMMTSFKHFLRKRYGINTNQEKELLIPIISKFSGIGEENISMIFEKDFKINYSNESKSKGVVSLYQALESFYANCK